jgi:predicted dehydrogenase
MHMFDRRGFLKSSTLASSAALAPWLFSSVSADDSAERELSVGVIGTGRGLVHANSILNSKNVALNYVCDVDQTRLSIAMKTVGARGAKPQAITDFRRMLDDPKLDAVFVATCNHWHAPATILACAAGKHVYVEKPGSHNAHEGELMVQAARKNNRLVQMGNQRRTWPGVKQGIAKLQAGAIGKVLYARCWYDANRQSIGKGQVVPVPANLDYSLWQGPAPERPYLDNLVHYNWHWRWHWGGGELANNGIHSLDVARWGLGVDYPTQISYLGGRYHFDDDQETPDTGVAVFHFGDKGCSWEVSSCLPRKDEKHSMVIFYGTDGTLHILDSGYEIRNPKGDVVDKGTGPTDVQDHIQNFFNAIRTGEALNSEIEEGQKSTLLCHLGNISYRLGQMLKFDPKSRRIVNNVEADVLWSREYRPGWEPVV